LASGVKAAVLPILAVSGPAAWNIVAVLDLHDVIALAAVLLVRAEAQTSRDIAGLAVGAAARRLAAGVEATMLPVLAISRRAAWNILHVVDVFDEIENVIFRVRKRSSGSVADHHHGKEEFHVSIPRPVPHQEESSRALRGEGTC